jgi:small subunit ribosomal protein S13
VARIAGVDLPRNKRVEIGLTYIFGVGRSLSNKVLKAVNVDPNKKTDQLGEDEVAKIRDYLEKNFQVEGELRRVISQNIKRLIDLGTYRGIRHRKNLPVRGQRTHTNARTRKGPRKTIAVRKQLKVMK